MHHSPSAAPAEIWRSNLEAWRTPMAPLGLPYSNPYAPVPFAPHTGINLGSLGGRLALANDMEQKLQNEQAKTLRRGIEEQMNTEYRSNLVPQAYDGVATSAAALETAPNLDEKARNFLQKLNPEDRASVLNNIGGHYYVNQRAVRNELERTDPSGKRSSAITSPEMARDLAQYQGVLRQAQEADPRSTALEYTTNPPRQSYPALEAVKGVGKGVLATLSTVLAGASLVAGKGELNFPTLLYGGLALASWNWLRPGGNPVNTFIQSPAYARMMQIAPDKLGYVMSQLQSPQADTLIDPVLRKPSEENKQAFLQNALQDGAIDQTTYGILQQIKAHNVGVLVGIAQNARDGSNRAEFQQVFESPVDPTVVAQLRTT